MTVKFLATLMTLAWATACVSNTGAQTPTPRISSAATDSARTVVRALVERERLPGFSIA